MKGQHIVSTEVCFSALTSPIQVLHPVGVECLLWRARSLVYWYCYVSLAWVPSCSSILAHFLPKTTTMTGPVRGMASTSTSLRASVRPMGPGLGLTERTPPPRSSSRRLLCTPVDGSLNWKAVSDPPPPFENPGVSTTWFGLFGRIG